MSTMATNDTRTQANSQTPARVARKIPEMRIRPEAIPVYRGSARRMLTEKGGGKTVCDLRNAPRLSHSATSAPKSDSTPITWAKSARDRIIMVVDSPARRPLTGSDHPQTYDPSAPGHVTVPGRHIVLSSR